MSRPVAINHTAPPRYRSETTLRLAARGSLCTALKQPIAQLGGELKRATWVILGGGGKIQLIQPLLQIFVQCVRREGG